MIEVLVDYGGLRTNGRRIKPGLYAEDDAALMGQAEFLVETGRARRVAVPLAPIEDATEGTVVNDVPVPAESPAPRKRTSKGGG